MVSILSTISVIFTACLINLVKGQDTLPSNYFSFKCPQSYDSVIECHRKLYKYALDKQPKEEMSLRHDLDIMKAKKNYFLGGNYSGSCSILQEAFETLGSCKDDCTSFECAPEDDIRSSMETAQ